MTPLIVSENLWRSTMIPEGILERWHVLDGAEVRLGGPVCDLLIENTRQVLTAPHGGRVTQFVREGEVIEPGRLIGLVGHA